MSSSGRGGEGTGNLALGPNFLCHTRGRWGGEDRRRGSDQGGNDWNANEPRRPGGGDGRRGEFEGRREELERGMGADSSFRWRSL